MKVVSLSATHPYPSSLISSATTVQRRHRHSLPQNHPLEGHYQRKAKKYWDSFYKRHKSKFFKDRHYLENDWGNYFSDDSCCPNGNQKVVLEVGCGAGNTIFPLVAAYPKLYVHACDIAPHAIELVKDDAIGHCGNQ